MEERFERLRAAFPQFTSDYTPPWGLATADDFADLARRFGCEYPPSFVLFQTRYAAVLPAPDNAFRWAAAGLETYLSLEDAITSAVRVGVPPTLLPFWLDEGNFTCFDTAARGRDGECPVVFWDHVGGSVARDAAGFVEWLSAGYARMMRRRASS